MCSLPPAPPPPPPPLPPSTTALSNSIGKPLTFINAETCQWASQEPRLWEACARNSICLSKAPYQYKYKHFESIIQQGPTCGLVALSMLLNGEVSPEELLKITKQEGFSNYGEMFSCRNMAKLAQNAITLAKKENINIRVKHCGLFNDEIIFDLLDGAVLLVAYDADFNHSPCQRRGHTAHWALVCGVIIVDEPVDSYTSNPNNVYVLCNHGKSKYLTAWPLQRLDKSNKNLWELCPKKQEDSLTYLLPEGGIGGIDGVLLPIKIPLYYSYSRKYFISVHLVHDPVDHIDKIDTDKLWELNKKHILKSMYGE